MRNMPNTHLEHPEDLIFSSRRAALRAVKQLMMSNYSNLSVKWDGAPAIVFGTHPETGKFFVGTKSVFNKVKIKINYNNEDIDKNHSGNVADILRLCLKYLPRIDGIVQADWIGIGGGEVYTPNIITYKFSSPITQNIILAPHTRYETIAPYAKGYPFIMDLSSTHEVYFVNHSDARVNVKSWFAPKLVAEIISLIPFAKVPNSKLRHNILREINNFVRAGNIPSFEILYKVIDAKYKGEVNVTTLKVWYRLSELKQRLLDAIVVNGNVDCYIDDEPTCHEGFVTVSNNPFKIVDRLTFSKANFNLRKNW